MSDNEALLHDSAADDAITVQPSALAPYGYPAEWTPAVAAASPAEASGGSSLITYFHALRRHWILATVLGSLCALPMALLAWWICQPQYTAVASIVMRMTQPVMLNNKDAEVLAANEFEGFKETQKSLMLDRPVLTAALRNKNLTKCVNVQRQDARHNALNWLSRQVDIREDKKFSELVHVAVTLDDAQEAATVVNAVIEAYMSEVVNRDVLQRRARLTALQELSVQKDGEVRELRTQLAELAKSSSAADEDGNMPQKVMLIYLEATATRQYAKDLEFKLKAMDNELKSLKLRLESVSTLEVSELEIMQVAQYDPQFRMLNERLSQQTQLAASSDAMIVQGVKTGYSSRFDTESKLTKGLLNNLLDNYKEKVREMRRVQWQNDFIKLQNEAALLREQVEKARASADELAQKADNATRPSVELKMARSQLAQADRVLAMVTAEKDRLRVELGAPQRVYINGDANTPAVAPETESGRIPRPLGALLGGLVGLCLPCLGLILWDVRNGRISAPEEVSKRLGLSVLGAVPLIPARVIRQLSLPSKRNQLWRIRLTESVDSVAARLLRNAEQEQARVILISSAMPGEGKTTLSTQLALSLARHMRRTVLVDFDLRRPSLAGVFGLPQEPGVCEALRGQADALSLIQASGTENLSVLPAGRWDRQVLAALGNGVAKSLIEQLRASFDFVILDSSPILPVVDTRLVSQHADAVILSVFRDVSEGPRIVAAHEILEAFGVRTIDTVVTGGQQHSYGKGMDYQPTLTVESETGAVGEEAAEVV